jgi:hypothetical protein
MTMKMDETPSELERRTRAVLEHSLTRIDARTRSRLNQARHAALESAARSRPVTWRGLKLIPVTGGAVAAAVLAVAFVLFTQRPHPVTPGSEGTQPYEVLDLLADEDNLNLMEDYDHSFYEWAAAQGDKGDTGGDTSDSSAGG